MATESKADQKEDKAEDSYTSKWYCKQLLIAEEEADMWKTAARDAYKEYTLAASTVKDYKWNASQNQHIPLFWANIQTLQPAIYSQTPIPVIKRRFDDKDDVARVASTGLERFAKSILDQSKFDRVLERLIQDFLIAGRGLGRVYYQAIFSKPNRVYVQDPTQAPPGTELQTDDTGSYYEEEPQISTETVAPRWISYETVLSTPGARDWQEVWWVAFTHFYDKRQFKERFKGFIEKLPDWEDKIPFCFDSKRDKKDDTATNATEVKATGEYIRIYEVWNKRDKKVCWVCAEYSDEYFDEQDDLYDLVGFFPLPEPIQATVGDQTLYPVPDYVQYRQCLYNIDYLANRCQRLIRAMRARGVYDASQDELRRLASEAGEADLVPVENYIAFQEKGGLENTIQYVPVEKLAAALVQCYEAIDRQKQLIYEITGISDIVRGQTAASETATAQQIKSQFADIRIRRKVREIARIARDLIENMCDLALSRFSDQTITEQAGVQYMSPQDQQLWPQALELLKNDKFRNFRIEIETDSTIAISSSQDKEARVNLLNSLTAYFNQLVQVGQSAPELLPAMADASLYAIRGLKEANAIEGSIEASVESYQERLMNPEPPPPDPAIELEQQKQQIAQEKNQMDMQAKAQKIQSDAAKAQMDAQMAQAAQQMDAQRIALEAKDLELQRIREEKDAEFKQFKELLDIKIEREKIAADKEIANLKATVDLLTAKMQMAASEEEGEGESGSESKGSKSKGSSAAPTMHFHIGGGKKVGGWVDTPDGRKLVVEDLPEESPE